MTRLKATIFRSLQVPLVWMYYQIARLYLITILLKCFLMDKHLILQYLFHQIL